MGLASVLHGMVCLLDPKTIVFGGSVSNYNPDFIELVKEELAELLHHEQKHILEHIQASTIKGDNGIIGAGLLVIE
jgi:glucokinase